jgi:H+-transporting ATPase
VVGIIGLDLAIEPLRTLAFVAIVFGNQATTYANRERRHLWSSRPGFWLILSSIVDILIASTFAIGGVFMTPLPAFVVAGVMVAAIIFAFVVDAAKGPVYRRLEIA